MKSSRTVSETVTLAHLLSLKSSSSSNTPRTRAKKKRLNDSANSASVPRRSLMGRRQRTPHSTSLGSWRLGRRTIRAGGVNREGHGHCHLVLTLMEILGSGGWAKTSRRQLRFEVTDAIA